MRVPAARPAAFACLALLGLTACTGLVAGPEVSAVTPLSVSRDSAYVRAKRALTAEVFTLDVQDSLGGRLTGTRYPASSAKLGTSDACRVRVELALGGTADAAELSSKSRWIAAERTSATNAELCETERQATLDRVQLVIAPAQP